MLYHNVRVMGSHLMFIDAMGIGILSAAGLWFSKGQSPFVVGDPVLGARLIFCLSITAAFMIIGNRMQAYHARRTERITDELVTLGEISLYAAAIAALATEALAAGLTSSDYLIVLGIDIVGLLALRIIMRAVIRKLRSSGKDYRVWLIIGNNNRAETLATSIRENPHFGIRLAEVVDLPDKHRTDLTDEEQCASSTPNLTCNKPDRMHRVLHDVYELRVLLEEKVIDEVVVTLPVRSYYDEVEEIVRICREAGISVKLPPDTFGRNDHDSRVVLTGGTPMVTHFTGPSNQAQLAIKRIIDLLGANVGLVLLSPLFLIVAIAIKLDSSGPVFFRSTRIGLHGREFSMIKFRSMIDGAPKLQAALRDQNETDGVAFKIKDDPRITKVGRFLRQYHLDELPQLWNVLTGDMSLVGPRPLPPKEACGTEWWQRRRLSMPPGLTCFWQVQGDHNMPFHQWAQLDLKYIDDWSIWVDIKLIASTVFVMTRRQGW